MKNQIQELKEYVRTTKDLPDYLKELTFPYYVDFSIPKKKIIDITQVTGVLYLELNPFLNFSCLMKELSFHNKITNLNLYDNSQISSLEGVVFPTSLTKLYLTDNEIKDFSHIFPYLNQLKEFRYDIDKIKTQEELIRERIGNKRKADNL